MATAVSNREFSFTREDFDHLRGIASATTGIVLSDDKFDMMYSRLSRRIRLLGLDSFAAYRAFLREHQEQEIVELINALTTNLTSFFREPYHFEHLRELLSQGLAPAESKRRLRIWSAGCSTGEEAYSIALTLFECVDHPGLWDISVLATDIDSHVLETAARGSYDEAKLKGVSPACRQRWFLQESCSGGTRYRIRDEVRRIVEFRQLNLLHDWPMHGPFDVIFCRNVIIYFDRDTKRRIVERFSRYMHDNSLLFLGHSESLFRVTDRFSSVGHTVYSRRETCR